MALLEPEQTFPDQDPFMSPRLKQDEEKTKHLPPPCYTTGRDEG